MELFVNDSCYDIVDGRFCLNASRVSGKLSVNTADLRNLSATQSKCIGQICGVVGKLQPHNYKDPFLLLITKQKLIGRHPLNDAHIFRIEHVVAVPLSSEDPEFYLGSSTIDACSKHAQAIASQQSGFIAERSNVFKSTADSFKLVSDRFTANKKGTNLQQQKRDVSERRLLDEILRIFNENASFYYSPSIDLTNSLQRLQLKLCPDERFFWNKHMLLDLIDLKHDLRMQNSPLDLNNLEHWIVPVIQGYLCFKDCAIPLEEDSFFPLHLSSSQPVGAVSSTSATKAGASVLPLNLLVPFELYLISRRSIHRAGTRYIKRGLDEHGHCANYVETEQIVRVSGHLLSFVQVRGSVPVYWSQPGYKYRPPPKLDLTRYDSDLAFRKHIDEQLNVYGNSVVAISLVELVGREKVLADAFLDHVIEYDSSSLSLIAFDFHEHCRGLKFENVSVLIKALNDLIQQMRFCWVDKRREMACEQDSVFRVNCVDCLDRTNVVQTAIAKAVLETQLRKVGLLSPDRQIPRNCLMIFQEIWANNGDVISRQYAGTAALKGDFTRTGQRNFAGVMKDGYNSASRYYTARIKDARRQDAIDALLGKMPTIAGAMVNGSAKESTIEDDNEEDKWLTQRDEELRLLVADCQRLLIPDDEVMLGGWALINADIDRGDVHQEDMDCVVLLTRQAYYVAYYDEETDKFADFERIPLENVLKIELGPMTLSSVLGVARTKATCMRVWISRNPQRASDCFHVWRSASTRLFNNLAIAIKNEEDAAEYIKSITEQFKVAINMLTVPHAQQFSVQQCAKLERKHCKQTFNATAAASEESSHNLFGQLMAGFLHGSSPTPVGSEQKANDSKSDSPQAAAASRFGAFGSRIAANVLRGRLQPKSFFIGKRRDSDDTASIASADLQSSNKSPLAMKQSFSTVDFARVSEDVLPKRLAAQAAKQSDLVSLAAGILFGSSARENDVRAKSQERRFCDDTDVKFRNSDAVVLPVPPKIVMNDGDAVAVNVNSMQSDSEAITAGETPKSNRTLAAPQSMGSPSLIQHASSTSHLPADIASGSDLSAASNAVHASSLSPKQLLKLNTSMPSSRSEGSLKHLNNDLAAAENDASAGSRFMRRFSPAGKLFGLTAEGFARIGDQFQQSQRAISQKFSRSATSEHSLSRQNAYLQPFVERIAKSKSNVIVL